MSSSLYVSSEKSLLQGHFYFSVFYNTHLLNLGFCSYYPIETTLGKATNVLHIVNSTYFYCLHLTPISCVFVIDFPSFFILLAKLKYLIVKFNYLEAFWVILEYNTMFSNFSFSLTLLLSSPPKLSSPKFQE